MSKVKFNARMDYEYLDNFKVLQKAFKTHGIDKVGEKRSYWLISIDDVLSLYQWRSWSSERACSTPQIDGTDTLWPGARCRITSSSCSG
jgi:RP/EB family microtubule-associated protein